MEINQLKPVDVVRNDYGSWSHPEFDKYWEANFNDAEGCSNEQWDELKRYFNIETFQISLELDNYDQWEKYGDGGDLSDWNPEKPVASGDWFLMLIYGNEDGAFAEWAKEKVA
ncbi:hypothetical protein [Acinetobacter pullicarnis]|uniref:hypothetical protein n=1 Tax=Acinetobacter pullicarnis TaxID=2576829 RepID=UPI001120789A|nr:hypothetical protein [Acinetobacter pullicarnis]